LRRLLILGLLAAVVLPSQGEKRFSVAQLEQLLVADHSGHKQDFDIAKQIAGIVLTDRISETTFARLNALVASNPQASLALRLLADQSGFLNLPASESVDKAIPEIAAQMRMLQAARNYVSQTLARLPNFLATRTINLFDDTPRAIRQGEWPTRAGLHLMGTSRSEISVNREREDQPPTQGSAVWQSKIGLISGGEFGTTLGMILTDTAQAEARWSHWERTSAGLLAVFRYVVPAAASHFEVISSFQREANLEGFRTAPDARGVAGIGVRPNGSTSKVQVVHMRPAYHGSIWLNPADGTIFRITMEADANKDLPIRRAAILVEYGPVEVGGSRFICPVRSLALSEALATAESISGAAATEWLNETLFTDYHRFGSSSRIVEEANTSAPVDQSSPAAKSPSGSGDASRRASSSIESGQIAQPGSPASDEPQAPSAAPPASPLAPTAKSAEPATPAGQPSADHASLSNASPPPETNKAMLAETLVPPSRAQAQQSGFTLRVDVNSLVVPAVVLDKSGRAVGVLGKEDFIVLDDGRAQTITGFSLIQSAQMVSKDSGKDEGRSRVPATTTHEVSSQSDASGPAGTRFITFLFDDRHMTTADLPLVKKAAMQLLEQGLHAGDYAAVLSLMGVNSGITRDAAVLQSAVMKLSVHQTFQPGKEDCPRVDYYSADQIINKRNPIEFQIAAQEAKQCSFLQISPSSSQNLYNGINNPNDPFQQAAMAAASHSLAIGEEDARESLVSVQNIVRAMSKLPGQRVLILISPGFLTLSPETMAEKSEIMDIAAASDVIVNALDARGLFAGNVDSSERGATSTLSLITGQPMQNKLASMQASEDVMSELAVGTGGKFFHNSNDLKGGMETLTAVPGNLYLLEISLKDVKANGAYHRLQVKVDQPGLEVVARKGYLAPK
jgi:VWFA-related protein